VLSYSSTDNEYTGNSLNVASLTSSFADEGSCGSLYLLLRASRAFRAERSRWPGEVDSEGDTDIPALKQCVTEVAKELGINGGSCPVGDELIQEFCRWAGAEMHAVASVMGGIASQEAIKAVTRQYVPLDNTFIWNGSNGTAATLTL